MKQKTSLTIAITAVLLMGLTSMTSCGENSETSHKEEIHNHDKNTYACPMHPEITGEDEENCSICGMDLVEVD